MFGIAVIVLAILYWCGTIPANALAIVSVIHVICYFIVELSRKLND